MTGSRNGRGVDIMAAVILHFSRLRLDLEPLLSRSFSIEIRPARFGDAVGIATVEVETWRDAYPGLLPNQALIGMNPVRAAAGWSRTIAQLRDPTQLHVALSDGIVLGFCFGGAVRRMQGSEHHHVAEIYSLYVDPNYQGCGIGTALMFQTASCLQDAGFSALVLTMLNGNRIAQRFYEHLGGESGEELTCVVFGTPTREVFYRWCDIALLLDRLETAMG